MRSPLELGRSVITIFTSITNTVYMHRTRVCCTVYSLKCNSLGCVHCKGQDLTTTEMGYFEKQEPQELKFTEDGIKKITDATGLKKFFFHET